MMFRLDCQRYNLQPSIVAGLLWKCSSNTEPTLLTKYRFLLLVHLHYVWITLIFGDFQGRSGRLKSVLQFCSSSPVGTQAMLQGLAQAELVPLDAAGLQQEQKSATHRSPLADASALLRQHTRAGSSLRHSASCSSVYSLSCASSDSQTGSMVLEEAPWAVRLRRRDHVHPPHVYAAALHWVCGYVVFRIIIF